MVNGNFFNPIKIPSKPNFYLVGMCDHSNPSESDRQRMNFFGENFALKFRGDHYMMFDKRSKKVLHRSRKIEDFDKKIAENDWFQLGYEGSSCLKLKKCVFDGEYRYRSGRSKMAIFQIGDVDNYGIDFRLANKGMHDVNNNTDRPYNSAFLAYNYLTRKFSQFYFRKNCSNYNAYDTGFYRPFTFLFCFTDDQAKDLDKLKYFLMKDLNLVIYDFEGVNFVFSRFE